MTGKGKKTLNLRGDDQERWKRLKMRVINEYDNPDLNDIELLREMMDYFEEKLETGDKQ